MNSPPLTEDSGQWSSSFPSSPIKEQSPVHQPGSKGSVQPHRSGHFPRKSDLYGTPHWWPIESSTGERVAHDEMKDDTKSSKCSSLEQSEEMQAEVVATGQPSSTHNDGQHQKSMAFVIDFNNDTTDDELYTTDELASKKVSEDQIGIHNDRDSENGSNGTYTLDEPRQNVDVCNVNGSESISSGGELQDSWIYKWANDAAGRLNSSSYEEEDNNNSETKEILSETEKIVECMQSRVQRSQSNVSPEKVKKYPASMIKVVGNRAFNIRRTLNTNPVASNATYDSDNCCNKSNQPVDNGHLSRSDGHFSRNDGGRFSLRMSRGDRRNFNSASDPEGHPVTPVRASHVMSARPSLASEASSYRNSSPHPTTSNKFTPFKPPINSVTTATAISSLKQQPKSIRSNSTMSSRDIELENWRRRKSYDPMRASGMCQRLTGSNSNVSASESKEPVGSSPLDHRKNSSSSLNSKKKDYLKRSSVKPSNPPPSPTTSSSPHKLQQPCCGNSRLENTSAYSCGEEHSRVFSDYKAHCQVQGHLEQRKFEALDTLVISTIHSLSTKVRNLSLNLLKKIRPTHVEDENAALLEEMITQLTELILDRVLCDQDSSSASED